MRIACRVPGALVDAVQDAPTAHIGHRSHRQNAARATQSKACGRTRRNALPRLTPPGCGPSAGHRRKALCSTHPKPTRDAAPDALRGAIYPKPAGSAKETISRSQAMSMVKVAVAEYLQTNGELPRKVADLGVGEQFPKNFRLLGNGALEVLVDGNSNVRVYWRLMPSSTSFATWECVSPDIANLSERLEDCRYDPSYRLRRSDGRCETQRSPRRGSCGLCARDVCGHGHRSTID